MTYSNVIAMACEELGVPFADYELMFESHIRNCLTTFKSSRILTPLREDILVEQGRILLPTNAIKVTLVAGYMDGWSIQGRYIVLERALCTLYDETEVEVCYEGLDKDEDGEVIIPDESFGRMLIAYIGWKHSRKMERPRHIMDDYYREYVNTKRALI